jgi:NAD+ diphosphatase
MASEKQELLNEYIFFGHDTVNRFSFLRGNTEFISKALNHPTTKIAVFKNGSIYGTVDSDGKRGLLRYFTKEEVGVDLINQWILLNEAKDIKINDTFFLTFLGLNEREAGVNYKSYTGQAYFAIDVAKLPEVSKILEAKDTVELITDRNIVFKLNSFDSGVFSHGKMYLDWLTRTRFCSGCGSKTIPIDAGTKLLCSSPANGDCPVRTASVSNASFPRTDSVIITAVTNQKFDKILLGRGKRFPVPMYSCVAGFVEPSETIEVAALREVWEETGVRAYKLELLKTQPWPYPANLMIGCVAYVEENGTNEVIDLGHDPELLDAQWFDIKDIKNVLEKRVKKEWVLPPNTAIAHHLIDHVVKKYEELHGN